MSSRPSHQWDASNAVKHMKIDEESEKVQSVDQLPMIIDPMETERLVESLRKFTLDEVGNSKYLEQHKNMEKLNLQAHQNAMFNTDEYVLEAILTFDKFETLIHDLVLIDVWKEHIYPLLLDSLAGRNNMRLYFILYHEATVVNLLEVFLYHKHMCESGGEKILELVDYVAKKIARLNGSCSSFRDKVGNDKKQSAKEFAANLEAKTPVEELTEHFDDIDFRVCVSAVSIARFLCENADVSRITDTHDMLILFIPLIENPPWTRRTGAGKWEKLVDQNWKEVPPIDLLKITKLEGQPWLGLYALVGKTTYPYMISKEVFRSRYHLNTFRKGQLLRLRKYLNDILLDQLPFLADIQ
eukprot:gene25042-32644_t